jgi:hypothetical protein
MLGNFWVAVQVVASQEGLSSMELVIYQLGLMYDINIMAFYKSEILRESCMVLKSYLLLVCS